MYESIVWTCEHCGTTVAADAGYVWVDDTEARNILREKRKNASQAWKVVTWDELEESTRLAAWHVTHADCDTKASTGYWIGLQDLRTPSGLLRSVAHLIEKDWVTQGTNLSTFIYKALREVRLNAS